MTTNEFERDLNDQAGLKRPGRIDLRVFQNTPDAGDGHPGVQRCFRNYLHEGGMEKDLDLVGYSIKGTSVNINNVEMQQLSNIGTTTIIPAQWVFVGEADQAVKQASSPTFVGLTLSANLVTTSTIDSVDVGDLKSAFDTHKASTGADHTYIDQSIINGSSPTFASPIVTNLNLADDIVHIGDTNNLISFGIDTQDFQTGGGSRLDISDDGVRFGGSNVRVTGIINSDSLGTSDVVLCTQGNVKAYADVIAGNLSTHAGSTGESHTYINQDLKTSVSPIFVGLTLSANLVTTSTIDSVDISAIRLNSMPTAANGDISANSQKITSLGTPTADSDASTKVYVDETGEGIESATTVVMESLTEVNTRSDTFIKIKQITSYVHLNGFRVVWDHKRLSGTATAHGKVYVNGVAIGNNRTATTTSYVETYQEFAGVDIRPGDQIEIWAQTLDTVTYYWVKDMEIRYDIFTADL